ncbi:hypothetical protein ACFFLM_08140 [Deinococcus oregonensis]|uniref:ArsR family transcriptional regulator n=1 Tax=Deinococcus oregonensis TaxID=1805970 RepID=A0ABV6AZ73_9DEIO
MEDHVSPSYYVVRDALQAKILTDPRSKMFFTPFLATDCTVKDAAELVGCRINTMLYRVRLMLNVGLLWVKEVRPRHGRAVKIYRSAHDAYFIPLATTPFDTLEQRALTQGEPNFRRLIAAYSAALQEHEHSGHLVYRADGVVYTTDLPPPRLRNGKSLFFHDLTVELTATQASHIVGNLKSALTTAQESNEPGADTSPYIVMLAIVPLK